MRSAKLTIGIALLLVGILSLVKIEAAFAQLSISTYPLSIKGQIDPGQTIEGTVNIINSSENEPVKIRLEKENLMGGAEGVVELLGEVDTGWGISSWVKFDDDSEFILAPKERRAVSFKIEAPLNAQPGGHFGAILFRALPVDKSVGEQSGVNISGRVGSVLLFEVTGDVKKEAYISSINAPKFLNHGPLDISFKIKNDGNSYFTPTGQVEYKNLWMKTSEEFYNPGKKETDLNKPGVVFPGYDRTYNSNWNKKYFFGPVKITVNAQMEEGGAEIAPMSIIIWAFPLNEALILFGILLVLWIAIKIFRSKFKIVKV
jgi:hypothetical protein